MAKTTITHVTDDLDGSKDAEEIEFSFKGIDYQIDLGRKNHAAFEKAIKPYLDAATVVKRPARATARANKTTKKSNSGVDLAAVRAWATEQGLQVSSRGRVPGSVIEQYNAAH